MRFLVFCSILLLTLTSCQKTIDRLQEEAVVESITTGFWKVSKFMKGNADVTSTFSEYKFKFNENNTVDALKNNTLERSGSWEGNVTARTINAQFANTGAPLLLLNGTWNITNSTFTSVYATQTVNSEVYLLELNKL